MANIEYGPTSPNATNGTLRSGKHSAASGGGNGSGDWRGPMDKSKVAEPGRLEKSMKWSSTTDKPQLNLTNDPSANVMSKIRSMRFDAANKPWKAPSEEALKSPRWS